MSDTKQTRPFDEARAAALEALLAGDVSPGPWVVVLAERPWFDSHIWSGGRHVCNVDARGADSAALIAAARNELPDLLAAWRAERARTEEERASLRDESYAHYQDEVRARAAERDAAVKRHQDEWEAHRATEEARIAAVARAEAAEATLRALVECVKGAAGVAETAADARGVFKFQPRAALDDVAKMLRASLPAVLKGEAPPKRDEGERSEVT